MDAKVDELIHEFVADGGRAEDWWQQWRGSYSIAPTNHAPIVRDRGAGRLLELVRWDWEKPPSMPKGRPIINARFEKLTTSFWAPAFSSARCVVPMRGYYEWTGPKGKKTPHFLHGEQSLLAAAGLTWSMDVNGESTRCFVVITRSAQDASGEVHDRMPVFLTPEVMGAWLQPDKLTGKGRNQLLDAVEGSSMEVAATIRHHVVDPRVNNVRAVDPSDAGLIEPAG